MAGEQGNVDVAVHEGTLEGHSTEVKAAAEAAVPYQQGDPARETKADAAVVFFADNDDATECVDIDKETEEDSVASDAGGDDEEAPAPHMEVEADGDEVNNDETDSDSEYDAQMSGLEYIMTYKALPQYEIDLILEEPVERVPFTDSELFKNLCADPSATQDDIDETAAGYEERLDTRASFQEWVRSEYETKGCVVVSEEYIARRFEAEEFTRQLWEAGFANLHD